MNTMNATVQGGPNPNPVYRVVLNDAIAVEPFKSVGVEKEQKSGFAKAKQKVSLVGLRVVHGNDKIVAGAIVYVRGDYCASVDARNLYELDGQTFFFLPIKEALMVEYPVPTLFSVPYSPSPFGGTVPSFVPYTISYDNNESPPSR